jgi:hypothetical protein
MRFEDRRIVFWREGGETVIERSPSEQGRKQEEAG